jgi:hypothetical protein
LLKRGLSRETVIKLFAHTALSRHRAFLRATPESIKLAAQVITSKPLLT